MPTGSMMLLSFVFFVLCATLGAVLNNQLWLLGVFTMTWFIHLELLNQRDKKGGL